MSEPITKVIFRMFQDEVIAVFPEIPGTIDPGSCLSYMHMGQHGSCHPDLVIGCSRPATPEEYSDIKAELEGQIGYRLRVIKKRNISHRYARIKIINH